LILRSSPIRPGGHNCEVFRLLRLVGWWRHGTALLGVRCSTSLLRVSRVTCGRRSTTWSWTSIVSSDRLDLNSASWSVDAWAEDAACLGHVAGFAVVVLDVKEVEGVDVAGEVTEESQTDVDEEIGSAASHDGNSDWRDCEGLARVDRFWRDEHTEDNDNDEDDCRNHFDGSV